VSAVRQTPTQLEPQGAVAVLTATESEFGAESVTCIGDAVRKAHPTTRVVTPEEFRRTVFHYRIPEEQNERIKYLTLLANEPALRGRMFSMGIRYLVSVQAKTDSQQKGGVECGGAPGGAGCIGLLSWERQSRISASVFDLKEARPAGNLHASADGRPWFFFIFPSPLMIGLPAFTEGKACGEIGAAVAKFLAGETTNESPNETEEPSDK
jgi:hypothetical protein